MKDRWPGGIPPAERSVLTGRPGSPGFLFHQSRWSFEVLFCGARPQSWEPQLAEVPTSGGPVDDEGLGVAKSLEIRQYACRGGTK